MRIEELKQNNSIDLIEVSTLGKKKDKKNILTKQVQTKVLTDGDIEEIVEREPHFANYYSIDKLTYQKVFVKPKKVFLKNYHYIITILLANEYKNRNDNCFHSIKDIDIYLEDKEDKNALKDAKNIVNIITKYGKELCTPTIFSLLEKYDFEEKYDDIYVLKKEKIYEKK